MISMLLSRICILACGILYPGYMSFKTVRAKIIEDYVKWMMYWIVFAIFTTTEVFTDIFLTWFPFYYEVKVVLILWLLPTIGNGSSFVYKNCIHPLLKKHETRVDQHLEQVREKGHQLLLNYIKVAAMYVAKTVMDVINKNFPSDILGALSNTISGNERQLSESNNMIIEEIEEQEIVPTVVSKTKNRKPTAKSSTKTKNFGDALVYRDRALRSRHLKSEIDLNLNEK